MRHTNHTHGLTTRLALGLSFALCCLLPGCNGRTPLPDGFVIGDLATPGGGGDGGTNPGGDGGTNPGGDGGTNPGGDGGANPGGDGGTNPGGDGGMTQNGPCTAGAYHCGPNNSVEICNSSGTAWLWTATCAVSCSGGLCTGACSPGAKRCNSTHVETCNTAGTTWAVTDTCMYGCDSSTAQCELSVLDVTGNQMKDGVIVVNGDITVHSGATLSSPSGDLTLRAKNITVESGASIAVSPTGQSPLGQGKDSPSGDFVYGGSGGGYATAGGNGNASGGSKWGSDTDATVMAGSKGGLGGCSSKGGIGGGVLRLIVDGNITINGQVTANGTGGDNTTCYYHGGGGGGSGGGILLAASGSLTVGAMGSLSAVGGAAGVNSQYTGYFAGAGGDGRVKLLYGTGETVTGTVSGHRTDGALPPLTITSSTQPDQNLYYNDGFAGISLSWVRPFLQPQGYYQLISTAASQVPTPMNATFLNMLESVMYPPTAVSAGDNWFHIVPVDSMSRVGTVENNYHIRVNSAAPTVSSTSHPNQMAWNPTPDVFYQWTYNLNATPLPNMNMTTPNPQALQNFRGVYYVLDNYGDTVPTAASTFVPSMQVQILRSGLMPGIWVIHMVPVDTQGYVTKVPSTYRVQIGTDPGSGVILGQVVDANGMNVDGASVQINRGLYGQTTNSTGNYNFPAVPAGTWEIRAVKAGKMPAVQMVTVTKGGSATANLMMH